MSESSPNPVDPRVRLARDRTGMASFRTQLALDRTTLAWIRTALTMAELRIRIGGLLSIAARGKPRRRDPSAAPGRHRFWNIAYCPGAGLDAVGRRRALVYAQEASLRRESGVEAVAIEHHSGNALWRNLSGRSLGTVYVVDAKTNLARIAARYSVGLRCPGRCCGRRHIKPDRNGRCMFAQNPRQLIHAFVNLVHASVPGGYVAFAARPRQPCAGDRHDAVAAFTVQRYDPVADDRVPADTAADRHSSHRFEQGVVRLEHVNRGRLLFPEEFAEDAAIGVHHLAILRLFFCGVLDQLRGGAPGQAPSHARSAVRRRHEHHPLDQRRGIEIETRAHLVQQLGWRRTASNGCRAAFCQRMS